MAQAAFNGTGCLRGIRLPEVAQVALIGAQLALNDLVALKGSKMPQGRLQ
jgi:hypothetical protein